MPATKGIMSFMFFREIHPNLLPVQEGSAAAGDALCAYSTSCLWHYGISFRNAWGNDERNALEMHAIIEYKDIFSLPAEGIFGLFC